MEETKVYKNSILNMDFEEWNLTGCKKAKKIMDNFNNTEKSESEKSDD